MKKLLPFLFAICFLPKLSQAQFPYSTSWAGYTPTYSLTSGFATTYTPGFLYFGYQQTLQLGNWPWWPNNMNFFCKGAGASSMWKEYKVYEGHPASCTGSLTQITNGCGITAIETNGKGGSRFAVTGAYNNGCYFTGLSNTGAVISNMLYRFPTTGSSGTPPSKPLIVQHSVSSDYFITGRYNGDIYVARVDSMGVLLWSSFYKIREHNTPHDIIINPYNLNNVIIVGSALNMQGHSDGFFLELDLSGNIIAQKCYGLVSTEEKFNSIIQASFINPANAAGFIIAGSISQGNNISPWLVKLDASGANIWQQRYQPSSGTNAGFVDIIERYNTLNSYEYYGLVKSQMGMVVLKLDAAGQPFPLSGSITTNEFVYDLPGASSSVPACISMVNGSMATPDVGIQVYGTASNWPGIMSSYMVKAYFNGETSCYKQLQAQNPMLPAPRTGDEVPQNKYGELRACSNFQVVSWTPGGTVNFPCNGFVIGGDNQRTTATGIIDSEVAETTISIFPNPVKEKFTINYAAQENEIIGIELLNVIGKRVATVYNGLATENGNNKVEISLSAMELPTGIYFISAKVGSQSSKHKVIYTH